MADLPTVESHPSSTMATDDFKTLTVPPESPYRLARRLSSAGVDTLSALLPSSSSKSTSSKSPLPSPTTGGSERMSLLPVSHEASPTAPKSRWTLERLPQGGYAPGIEGLRGFAILMTALSHVATQPYAATDPLGSCGVTVFFVLSGYNIMGTLNRTAKTIGPDNSWRSRLTAAHVHRLKRLLPSILTMLFAMNCLNACSGDQRSWPSMARYSTLATTFTYNTKSLWLNGDPGPFINMWSLGPTEQFNLLMSLTAPVLMAWSESKRRSALLLVIAASFALRAYTSAFPDNVFGTHWHYDTAPNLCRFLTGAVLRLLPLPQIMQTSQSIYAGVLLILSAPYLMTWAQPNYRLMAPGWADIVAPLTLWGDILCAAGACVIIAGSRTVSTSPAHYDARGANALMESTVLQFFGKISYAFYLFQLPLLIASGWPRGWNGVAFEGLALCCAMATTFWIDPVAKKWLQRPAKTPSRRPSANTQAEGHANKQG